MALKTFVTSLNPLSKVNFVKLPLAPKLCKLPKDEYEVPENKIQELLEYNHFLANYASDDRDKTLSMELMGLDHESDDWVMYKVGALGQTPVEVPTRHDKEGWREFWQNRGWNSCLHLTDDIRRGFWWRVLVPHFRNKVAAQLRRKKS